MAIVGEDGITLRNVCLAVSATSQTDNTALKLTNSFWIYRYGGCDNTASAVPAEIWTTENIAGETPATGILDYEGVLISAGLGISYIQRTPNAGPISGDWFLANMTLENATNDFLTLTNTSGSPMQIAGISMDHVQTADSPSTQSIINFSGASSSDTLSGVVMNQVLAGSGGFAIKMTTGTLGNFQTNACSAACTWQVVDSSGNLTGAGQIQDYGGSLDFVSNWNSMVGTAFLNNTVGARFFQAGKTQANLGVDAFGGFMFNTGSAYGFSGSLFQSAPETFDVQFAKLLPPTGVAGTAASGSSIANGTYYVWVSTTSDNCATQSAASLPSSAVTLSGSNGTINATWTLPITAYSAPDGYCVAINNTTANPPVGGAFFVARGQHNQLCSHLRRRQRRHAVQL